MTDPVKQDPPSPSWKAKAMTFAVLVLGALPFSGLIDDHPKIKIFVGIVTMGLAGIGYKVHATSLVDAHEAGKAIGSDGAS